MIKYYEHNGTLYAYNANYTPPEEMTLLTKQGYLTLRQSMPVDKSAIPTLITMRQTRLILNAHGLLQAIEVALKNAPMEYKIEWEHGSTVDRNSLVVYMLAGSLGLDECDLDDMFLSASEL